jgi:hypothetical protein
MPELSHSGAGSLILATASVAPLRVYAESMARLAAAEVMSVDEKTAPSWLNPPLSVWSCMNVC